jgi:hypothetical protein
LNQGGQVGRGSGSHVMWEVCLHAVNSMNKTGQAQWTSRRGERELPCGQPDGWVYPLLFHNDRARVSQEPQWHVAVASLPCYVLCRHDHICSEPLRQKINNTPNVRVRSTQRSPVLCLVLLLLVGCRHLLLHLDRHLFWGCGQRTNEPVRATADPRERIGWLIWPARVQAQVGLPQHVGVPGDPPPPPPPSRLPRAPFLQNLAWSCRPCPHVLVTLILALWYSRR